MVGIEVVPPANSAAALTIQKRDLTSISWIDMRSTSQTELTLLKHIRQHAYKRRRESSLLRKRLPRSTSVQCVTKNDEVILPDIHLEQPRNSTT